MSKFIEVLIDETEFKFIYSAIEIQKVKINGFNYALYKEAEFWKKDSDNDSQSIWYKKEYPLPDEGDVYGIIEEINFEAAKDAHIERSKNSKWFI